MKTNLCRVGQISDSPGDHHKDSNERNVRIAVGHGLVTDLHQADHRNQRPQKPQPARQQISLRAETQHHASDRQQHQGCSPPATQPANLRDEDRCGARWDGQIIFHKYMA